MLAQIIRIILIAMMIIAEQSLARDLFGFAQVIDGDSLVVDGRQIRLHGIDAPEWHQICQRQGKEWHAGQEAAAWLRSLADGKMVACAEEDFDARYHRVVATCFLAGTNLNQSIVDAGWAVAYRRYSDRYVDAEHASRTARRGIWQGDCDEPEVWRREHKSD